DQNHSVRLGDIPSKLPQIGFSESHNLQTEVLELLADRFLVEDTDYRVFTMNGRHDGNAEVDIASLITCLETSVLRDAALGDVEFRHDLDTRNNRGVMLLGDRSHRLGQTTIDPILNADFGITRLDMDVTGTPLQCGKDNGIDQADDRAGFILRQLLDG